MKVILANVWHQDNRGDLALTETAISAIQSRWPGASIMIYSMLTASSEQWESAHKILKRNHPEIEVSANRLPLDSGDLFHDDACGGTWRLVRAILAWLTGIGRRSAPGADLIVSADMVIAVGGHYVFTATTGVRSTLRLFRVCWPLLLAWRLGRPYVLFSQSFGPIHGWWSRRIVKDVVEHARRSLFRESISRDLCNSVSARAKTGLMPDSAFGLDLIAVDSGRAANAYAVLTVREPLEGSPDELTHIRAAYLEQMQRTCRMLLSRGVVEQIVVVPHVIGPTVLEDDRPISAELVALCADKRVKLEAAPEGLAGVLNIYARASVLIGTRLHSVIFALTQSVPAVAVSYFGPKALGIMSSIGMKPLCLDIRSIRAEEVVAAVQAATSTENRRAVTNRSMQSRQAVFTALDFVDL